MQSSYHSPINLGQNRLVTINELVDLIASIAGKKITKRHDLTKPQGVRGRNADITLIKKVLGWEPKVSLEKGLEATYRWIYDQLAKTGRIST
jgi:nucleoside-diphosphate-sugar epimerase